MCPVNDCAVALVELYQQWPGYFCDSFHAAQAGHLRGAGHRVGLFKAYMHADPGGVRADLLSALTHEGPWDLLVVDRVWSRELLVDIVAAAGGPRVLVNQWESPAEWPEVHWRISPISRSSTLGLADAVAAGAPPDPALPNLYVRSDTGAWIPPAAIEPMEVAREFAAPLDLAYDAAQVFGLGEAEAHGTRYMVLNMGCPYRGAANETGFLDGLELPTSWGASGCTFCNVGAYERQSAGLRRELMEVQLRALAERGAFRRLVVQDEYIFRDLDTLIDLVVAIAPPGVEIMVRARVDYLSSCEPQLLRALETLGSRGIITPYLIGFENFSDAELSRYNKGQTAAESEEAIATLDRLSATYPNLQVSPSQGFILFGPWTTLEDLEVNAAAFRRLGFHRFRGRLTKSKLRLNPDAALVARARADGLLVESYVRADEDNAAETGYQAEIPYRFAHADVSRVWELLNGPQPIEGDDEIDRLELATRRVRQERASVSTPP